MLQEHVTQLQKRLPIGVEEFILQGESEGKSFVKGGAGGADMGGGVIDAFNSDLIGRCVGLYFPYSAGKAFTCDTARSNRRWWAWSGGRGCAIVEDGGEWKIGREGGVGYWSGYLGAHREGSELGLGRDEWKVSRARGEGSRPDGG